jgi:glutathione S-transferase
MATDKYKLTHLNIRPRAEPIRMIFALKEIPYEDVRIERADWPAQKEKFPWGQVPVLEINGKTVLAESLAITRYLARKYGLTGANEVEAAKCDEYVDTIGEVRVHWFAYYFEKDAAKKETLKKELLDVILPKYFGKYETILKSSSGPYLLGDQLAWADIVMAHSLEFYEDFIDKNICKNFPSLQKLKEEVYNVPNIKAWINNRPKTTM